MFFCLKTFYLPWQIPTSELMYKAFTVYVYIVSVTNIN